MDNDFLVPGKEGNDTSCREIDCEIVNDDKTIIECETQVDNEANDGSYLILLKLTRRIDIAENDYSFDVIAKVMSKCIANVFKLKVFCEKCM